VGTEPLDSQFHKFVCPKCRQTFERKFGWLKVADRVECPICFHDLTSHAQEIIAEVGRQEAKIIPPPNGDE
jgi:hypothetical protein